MSRATEAAFTWLLMRRGVVKSPWLVGIDASPTRSVVSPPCAAWDDRIRAGAANATSYWISTKPRARRPHVAGVSSELVFGFPRLRDRHGV
jgi:hypothetical protein